MFGHLYKRLHPIGRQWGQSSATQTGSDGAVRTNLGQGQSGAIGRPWSFSEPWRNSGWLENTGRNPLSDSNSFGYGAYSGNIKKFLPEFDQLLGGFNPHDEKWKSEYFDSSWELGGGTGDFATITSNNVLLPDF